MLLFRIPTLLLLGFLVAVGQAQAPPKGEAAPKELQPRLVTLKAKDIKLSKVLDTLRGQTGIEVQISADGDVTKLNLDKVGFWHAIDEIAKEADRRVTLYGRDRKITLVEHADGWRAMPTSYSGLFRVVLNRIVQIRDLENNSGAGLARLEVAWEPSFQAFYLEMKPETLQVKDDRGLLRDLPRLERGRLPAPTGIAMQFEIPLPPFPRSSASIGSISGSFTMLGSPKLVDFTVDKLADGVQLKQDGVVLKLQNLKIGKELWTFDVSLQYPAGGPEFESFQSWLFNNQTYLVHKSGKRMEPSGFSDEQSGQRSATIRYRYLFDDEKDAGKTTNWKLIYRTPAPVVEVPVKFEFKDVPLP
jgi:hypothetical protein